VTHSADAVVGRVVGSPVNRRTLLPGLPEILDQPLAAGRGHVRLEEQLQVEIDDLLVGRVGGQVPS
jgi:hypothetical protein